MNTDGRTIWQVAAGDGAHHYANQCLCNGVVMMGPGGLGAWPECEARLIKVGWTTRKMGILRTFCETLKAGDLVVLHVGSSIYGVGEALGPYVWDERFAHVQGWDRQHTRPVKWLWVSYDGPRIFPPRTLGMGATIRPLQAGSVHEWLRALDAAQGDTPVGES